MKSLILETSTESALLAVVNGNELLAHIHLEGGPELSKSLGLEIKKITELSPPPFHRIIIGCGPGSYTGIRVGAAMAQALAFGWKIPLYSVSSLSGFAPKTNKNFVVIVDARSGGMFIQENFNAPKLLKLPEAEAILRTAEIIASPHPDRIATRIAGLTQLVKTYPDPLHLALHAWRSETPDLSYLSSPG